MTHQGGERWPPTTDTGSQCDGERLGFLAHELRNLLNTATLAFEVLKSGNQGVCGSTGAVLQRSLIALPEVVDRSLAEVRLSHRIERPEVVPVRALIEEVAAAGALEAQGRELTLTVLPVDDDVFIEADRRVLVSVMGNLLQNAIKFTRIQTSVTLRVRASGARVLIDVEDECGGLPDGGAERLFQPFEQGSSDRTGLGLGLAFSRWAVERNHGRIQARNLPSKGCVFTVDLPRVVVTTATAVIAEGLNESFT